MNKSLHNPLNLVFGLLHHAAVTAVAKDVWMSMESGDSPDPSAGAFCYHFYFPLG